MTTSNDQRTLALRMTESRIPVPEALHYAMRLAAALRKLHDAGKAHGAITPSCIELTATGLDLIPSLGPSATVTPYTAPEVLQGQPADARSDIFSFGALVFEMLTGRRAFDGDGQTELKLALCNSAPPPSGSPAVDRLVTSCVAKSPAARWQRMQKIIMELKLLTVAARRADAAPAARGVSDTAMRSQIQQLEGRLTARLAAYEKNIATLQEAVRDGQDMNVYEEKIERVMFAPMFNGRRYPVPPAKGDEDPPRIQVPDAFWDLYCGNYERMHSGDPRIREAEMLKFANSQIRRNSPILIVTIDGKSTMKLENHFGFIEIERVTEHMEPIAPDTEFLTALELVEA